MNFQSRVCVVQKQIGPGKHHRLSVTVVSVINKNTVARVVLGGHVVQRNQAAAVKLQSSPTRVAFEQVGAFHINCHGGAIERVIHINADITVFLGSHFVQGDNSTAVNFQTCAAVILEQVDAVEGHRQGCAVVEVVDVNALGVIKDRGDIVQDDCPVAVDLKPASALVIVEQTIARDLHSAGISVSVVDIDPGRIVDRAYIGEGDGTGGIDVHAITGVIVEQVRSSESDGESGCSEGVVDIDPVTSIQRSIHVCRSNGSFGLNIHTIVGVGDGIGEPGQRHGLR